MKNIQYVYVLQCICLSIRLDCGNVNVNPFHLHGRISRLTMFHVNSTRGRASKKASLIFLPSRSGNTVANPEPMLCTTMSYWTKTWMLDDNTSVLGDETRVEKMTHISRRKWEKCGQEEMERGEQDDLSEHNVEGENFKEKVTGDGENLLLLFIFFLNVAICRVIKVQSEIKTSYCHYIWHYLRVSCPTYVWHCVRLCLCLTSWWHENNLPPAARTKPPHGCLCHKTVYPFVSADPWHSAGNLYACS